MNAPSAKCPRVRTEPNPGGQPASGRAPPTRALRPRPPLLPLLSAAARFCGVFLLRMRPPWSPPPSCSTATWHPQPRPTACSAGLGLGMFINTARAGAPLSWVHLLGQTGVCSPPSFLPGGWRDHNHPVSRKDELGRDRSHTQPMPCVEHVSPAPSHREPPNACCSPAPSRFLCNHPPLPTVCSRSARPSLFLCARGPLPVRCGSPRTEPQIQTSVRLSFGPIKFCAGCFVIALSFIATPSAFRLMTACLPACSVPLLDKYIMSPTEAPWCQRHLGAACATVPLC